MATSRHVRDFAILGAVLRKAVLNAPSLDQGLHLLQIYAWFHWRNISGVFQDEALEAAFHDRWQTEIPDSPQALLSDPDFVHVATAISSSGGHSRLLRETVDGLSADHSQAVVLTDAGADPPVSGLPNVLCLKGTPSERCASLIAAARGAGTVLMFIHPDDSTAALAARVLRARGQRVLFVHHADHVFNLATGAADAVLEICATGWKTTGQYHEVHGQSFMGIPVFKDSAQPLAGSQRDLRGPVVSMGNSGKYRPTSELDFPRFLQGLMAQADNDVVLIGPSGDEAWWADVRAMYPDRLTFCGLLPPHEAQAWLNRAACYIDSFPLDGGTSYSQAVISGVPVFGPHRDSALGISPADELRVSNETDLLQAVTGYLRDGRYPFDFDAVRRDVQDGFSRAAVTARIVQASRGNWQEMPGRLRQLGRRSPDFNRLIWETSGKIRVPKRQWRALSPGLRYRLSVAIGTSSMSLAGKHRVLRHILAGGTG